MALAENFIAMVKPHLASRDGLKAAAFGICWPDSSFNSSASIDVLAGETLADAADRLRLRWSPGWLTGAGFTATDSSGHAVTDTIPATFGGPVTWNPSVRLPKVDDQVSDTVAPGSTRHDRRLAGEVALLSLWSQAMNSQVVGDVRPTPPLTSRNTRGSRFRDFLVYFLSASLPSGWRVEPEVPLTSIRGIHMRRSVGGRSSDIAVIDEGNRLVAVVSSKWSWRSDRGTEAAQMVPLRQYRPDVPYTLATAEFVRSKVVARESIEDRSYHLCPEWAGSWLAVYQQETARTEIPGLDELRAQGTVLADALGLVGLHDLVADLAGSGTIL